MNLFLVIFESVVILLGIGIVGFWIIRKKIVPESAIATLSPLALNIALPSLVFVNILSDFSPSSSPDWWLMPLWWLFFMGVAFLLTAGFSILSQKETRREFAISLFFQNGIFFPLAILAALYPNDPSYLVYLFLFTLFYPAFFFNTYHFFFKKKRMAIQWKKVFNTVLLATTIALVVSVVGVTSYVPNVIVMILGMLGAMTIPLIMLVIGGNIYIDFHKKGTLYLKEITKFVAIKNLAFPLIFLGIIMLIRPAFHVALILMIQSAVPPVTSVPIFTQRAGGNQSIVNQFVVSSFIVSLVTLPAMISLFSLVFPI